MALPAGRYGVTKNQLLKIKKLPMNTIKLIEELTEKFDLLGSAAFKNSTSVVTDSSDLVESGAVKDIVGWGNKNKLPIPSSVVTNTVQGVTFTVTRDNNGNVTEIDVNGTATADAVVTLINTNPYGKFLEDEQNYILSGCPSGGSDSTYRLQYYYNDSSAHFEADYGNGLAFTCNNNYDRYNFAIFIKANYTANHLKFYPMIRKADVTDASYEPYHASVEDTLRDAEVIEGKNLIGWKIGYVYSSTDGSLSPNTHGVCSDKIKVISGQKFIGSKKNTLGSNDSMYARTYDANGDFVGTITVLTNTQLRNEITIPANIGYIGVFQLLNSANVSREWLDSNEIMFYDASETDPTFEPYYTPLKDVVPNKADNSVIGTVEDGANPTKAYAVNEFMVRDGAFCQVTVPVTTSSTWTEGSNYTKKSIAEVLQTLMS